MWRPGCFQASRKINDQAGKAGGELDQDQSAEATVEIVNRRGLHARASALFCALAGSWDAVIRVRKDDVEVGGASIMGLLMLGAGPGSVITVSATGPQAREAVDALVKLVADRFSEEE